MLRFTLPMGELAVYGNEPLPQVLQPIAAAIAGLEDRFRPALLRPRLWPERQFVYVAVWPADHPLPCFSDDLAPVPQELQGVVLAEVHTLTCFVCFARFRALRQESALLGDHLRAHRLINGCPRCGSDFATSRIQALALLLADGWRHESALGRQDPNGLESR